MNPHHPPHYFEDDSIYFLTASTVRKQPFLRQPECKQMLRDNMMILRSLFSMRIDAWVILDNHYHLLVHSPGLGKVSRFIQRLHGKTAYEINKADNARGRQVWHNYWDSLIQNESDYWTRFNYIHLNPVKHGYVNASTKWEFSSFAEILSREGKDWVEDVLRMHPIVDFTEERY